MESKSLKAFRKFYEENKNKIYMSKRENYRLNYQRATLWANSQCDPESREFAHDIIKYTKYVSFKEFTDRIKIICNSYIKTYSSPEHKGTVFILIVPFKINKSNLWVSLLTFKYLSSIINDVYYDITDAYNGTLNHRSRLYRKRIRCIICDDCSYTGNQLGFISTFNYSMIQYPDKPLAPSKFTTEWLNWNTEIKRGAERYISGISLDMFSVDLIVPYMTRLAFGRLEKIHHIKIPRDVWLLSTFAQQKDVNRIPLHILNEFKKTFQYHSDISAIYFDHKIADSVSTFHKIYMLAPIFNCAVTNKRIGFIENCEKETTIPDDIKIYDYHIDIEPLLGKKACPPSFYKSIKYTFNNKIVDTNKYVFDVIEGKKQTK